MQICIKMPDIGAGNQSVSTFMFVKILTVLCPLSFRLTVCDLAGSERCKEQRNGERMKEASNINTSLLTLGRCISALRSNQNNKYVSKRTFGLRFYSLIVTVYGVW